MKILKKIKKEHILKNNPKTLPFFALVKKLYRWRSNSCKNVLKFDGFAKSRGKRICQVRGGKSYGQKTVKNLWPQLLSVLANRVNCLIKCLANFLKLFFDIKLALQNFILNNFFQKKEFLTTTCVKRIGLKYAEFDPPKFSRVCLGELNLSV